MQGSALPLELRAASNLWVDEVAGSVSAAFAERGIDSILLKGATIAQWLYGPDEVRAYGDADLLVSPAQWEDAQRTLRELGFAKVHLPLFDVRVESEMSEAWTRSEADVDLHRSLWGIEAEPREVWATLSSSAVEMQVGRRPVKVLDSGARAMHVALHLAQHGGGWPRADLERAVALLDAETWQRASDLALRLNATQAFVAGLRMVPGGAEIIDAVGLADVAPSADAALREWRIPLSQGIGQLLDTPGLRPKLALLFRVLFPSSDFMRWWAPIARRGRRGLTAAYAWRLVWLFRKGVPAVRAWRRATR